MMQEARLTQLIIEGGLVRADQLEIAQQESRKTETPLAQVLIDSGFVERHQLRDIYAGEMSMPSVSLQNLVPDSVALSLLSAERARTLCVFPLNADPDTKLLRLAVAERIDLLVQDTIQNQIPRDWAVTFCLATEHEILAAIDRFYGVELSIDGILTELDTSPEEEGSAAPPMVYTQPVVRLVDAILVDALRRLASDIHFEPEQNFVRIRYRIDGVLQNVRSLHKDHWPSMLVRIKVMCALNITETRAPQDGHLRLMLEGRNVDFRAATFPVLGGECVVIRILDRPASFLQLESLGIAAEQFNQLVSLLERPQGLLLVTGPTGSGKTTTLYSMLNQMAGEERNIVTMEDPVEYVLPMIRQCSVNNAPKLDFAGGVRAMLRQDPDVILVGETRDQETAEMVLRAALTGHLVLTTLHSATATGAFYRLQDLGLKLGHLSELLLGIVAQRLVRALCENCKRPVPVPEHIQPKLDPVDVIYLPGSCDDCGGSGYRGRLPVVELLVLDSMLHRMLATDCAVGELVAAAAARNQQTLMGSALVHLHQGKTSLPEIERVLGSSVGAGNQEMSQ